MSKINHHIERLEMHLEHDQSQVIEAIEKVETELKRVKDYAEHRYEGFISVPDIIHRASQLNEQINAMARRAEQLDLLRMIKWEVEGT